MSATIKKTETMSTTIDNIRKIAQVLISSESQVTVPLIREKVQWAMKSFPQGQCIGIDIDALVEELELRFNVWCGLPSTLEDNTNHEAWLEFRRGDISWQYWKRYKQLLEGSWAPQSLERLEEITDEILGRLEDPQRPGAWDRRGLVVGYVQSGKTANYTGLICKAADAGYKLIVVLAGIHNSLRWQTQRRLDKGFLGYDSSQSRSVNSIRSAIGVGCIDPSCPRPNTITNSTEKGDFNRAIAKKFNISPGITPLLFVIKKNASVLKNLLEWVEWATPHRDEETGRPVIRDVPLLVIDDEADYGSVDTREIPINEDDELDPEHDPTTINSRLRRLLYCFEQSAYVGYTATPFANIYIHEKAATTDEGEDLFPRSFIINLPAPSNYVGPVKVFGLDEDLDIGTKQKPGLPVIRYIHDHALTLEPDERNGWMPPGHKKTHRPLYKGREELLPSLKEAIRAFILVCAARRARGQLYKHNSMLIHVTRFTDVQHLVYAQVEAELKYLKNRLHYDDGNAPSQLKDELRDLWERDFEQTSEFINDSNLVVLAWDDIEPHLLDAVLPIQMKEMNGSAKDVLDYEENEQYGLNVIAVGGDKLSRGLTLEGLSVSYFLRASRMYDTLMQMGRWFGYREGYLDLCRLYMTGDIEEWYQYITLASEELRAEFEYMTTVGGTPRDYGLKVKTHPDGLMITAAGKMRHGIQVDLSFTGDISQTVSFHRDEYHVRKNYEATEAFLKKLGSPNEKDIKRERPGGKKQNWKETCLWTDVPARDILDGFLLKIATHPAAVKVNTSLLAEFIEKLLEDGELVTWTVALLSGQGEPHNIASLPGRYVMRNSAVSEKERLPDDRHRIRGLVSARDEAIDLDLKQYTEAFEKTQELPKKKDLKDKDYVNPRMIRSVRPKERGLLLIYPLNPKQDPNSERMKIDPRPFVDVELPIIGFALSFPSSRNTKKVKYTVNTVYWEQEYGE